VPCSASRVVPGAHRVVGPGTHRGSGPREVHTTTPSTPLILVVCATDSCRVMLVVTYNLCSCTTAALALVPTAPPPVPIYLSPLTYHHLMHRHFTNGNHCNHRGIKVFECSSWFWSPSPQQQSNSGVHLPNDNQMGTEGVHFGTKRVQHLL
jgi:hypothetical protein